MRDFFQQSDRIFFDEGTCRSFNYPEDFNKDFFKEFIRLSGISDVLDDKTIISNLQLKNENGYFKNGAVLFFGKEPQKFFPNAITRCLLFKGTNKTYILDDKTFTGNLLEQYNGALSYLRQKLNLNYIIEGAGPRKELLEIPEDIFKECLINSLSHRDYYEKGAVTHVEIFDDRVDITNPGGLVHSIAKEEFGTKSFSRNPLVFGLFLRMNMVEKIGSGINRMREEMRLVNLPEPDFRFVGFFTASFIRPVAFSNWINNWGDRLSTPLIKILHAIYDNPSVTKAELSDTIGQGKTSVDNHIVTLRKLGLIKRVGSRKNGTWKIIQLPNSG